ADMLSSERLAGERRILLVGLGLIGGSLAAALRAAGHRGEILACDRDSNEICLGQRMKLIDGGSTQLAGLVPGA
ncbi:hypothetical protein, partial [Psychrobacter proteolyticus]|uniref:hypothetical protein n=1 Tax=Psychrobacter proteolyticus TaxID=147825 RepID=UPI00311E7E89